jgi:hypothetical protein
MAYLILGTHEIVIAAVLLFGLPLLGFLLGKFVL